MYKVVSIVDPVLGVDYFAGKGEIRKISGP